MKTKKIRDPVHGDIFLTPEEVKLLDTPQLQRLRGIRQLGASFFVYPGASHSRFEHSLGTCWMAKKIINALKNYQDIDIPVQEKRAVTLAALLHDVTHIPFGHTFEDERKLLSRHDCDIQRYEYFIFNSEIGKRLSESESGRLALSILNPETKSEDNKLYLHQIVDGMICGDLLDYLKRDNYYCGLSLLYDNRLFHYFHIDSGNLTLKLHHDGIFRRDALSEITHLLRIRYVLSERVYYHHAKIAAGVMISKAIERALERQMAPAELYELKDDALIPFLQQKYNADLCLSELTQWFTDRNLFKRCYMISREIGDSNVKSLENAYHQNHNSIRNEMERNIASEIGAKPHEIAIYCPSARMALKEAQMPVNLGGNKLIKFCDLNSAETKVLQQQHRNLWKFYVFASPRLQSERKKIGEICNDFFGFPNELPVGKE